MPAIFTHNGAKFFFFSNEGDPLEPVHVHVRKDKKLAKFWLFPDIRLAGSRGFTTKELNQIRKIIDNRRDEIREAWNEHFDT